MQHHVQSTETIIINKNPDIMKRFLFLTLAMLTATVGAWAQNTHFQLSYNPAEEGSFGSTVVYAKLDLTPEPVGYREYEVAAFIGDECRAIATYGTSNPADYSYNYWVLDVKGKFDNTDGEIGQTITFKVYDQAKDTEYDLTPDRTVTFATDALVGEPSNPVVLSAIEWTIEPTGETLFCNVGDNIIDLVKLYYTIEPTGTNQTPPNVIYSVGSDSSADELTVSQTEIIPRVTGYLSLKCELEGTGQSIELEIVAYNWATGGKADPSTLTVYYTGSEFDILDQVSEVVTFTPEGYEELMLSVKTSNPAVVDQELEASDGELAGPVTVKGVGTATLTFTVSYPDYLSELGSVVTHESSFTLTVEVKQGLTRLTVPEKITVTKDEPFDLKTVITPYPENAEIDYSKLTYEYSRYENELKIENNILTGLQVCTGALVSVRYTDLPNFSAQMVVNVTNPATALVVNTPEITVNRGDTEGLTAALAAAVTTDPDDASDQIYWVSGDESIVKQTDNGWEPLAGGDVTMTAEIRDYFYGNGSNNYTVRLFKTITVHVIVPVESITINTSGITWLNVGDDLTDYLKSVVTILPEEATNKNYHFEVAGRLTITNGRVVAENAGIGRVKAVADDGSGVESAYKNFSIFIQASDVNFGGDIITTYNGDEIDISEQVKNNITFVPENASKVTATTTSSNPSVATVEVKITQTATNTPVTVDVTAKALSIGETTVTMAITYTDFLENLKDPRQDHSTTVERTFKIVVKEGLSGFTADYPTEMAIGGTYEIVLTPQPTDSEIDPTLFSFTSQAYNLPNVWNYVDFGEPTVQDDGTVVITVSPQEPCDGEIKVTYFDPSGNNLTAIHDEITVGVAMTLDQGWQWKTLWGPINNFENYFGNDGIVEVRSQYELMAYDSGIGYFGDLYDNGLQSNVPYKVKAKSAIDITKAGLLTGGNYVARAMTQNLLRGWTWIPNPYIHTVAISRLGIAGTAGDRIVSKEGGFAEYDGSAWTGTLTTLTPWQSYLYYSENGGSFSWAPETEVYVQSQVLKPISGRKINMQSSWQYDPRPYRDNMSIVAELEGITMPEQFTVGAFVDGECRGEGVCVNGRMFITVHAKSGEQISFRLRNEQTGEEFDIEQTLRFSMLQGSIQSPVRLSSPSFATGINAVHSSSSSVHRYDLSGRAVDSTQKGVVLQKQSNGTVKKVVVK